MSDNSSGTVPDGAAAATYDVWDDVRVVVGESENPYELLKDLVAGVLGTSPDAIIVGSAPCPECGGPHGRPVVVPGARMPHVSVSSAGAVVAVAVSDAGPVGVDVEAYDKTSFAGFADVALHPDERPAVRDVASRATVWARKEAALKAAGVGLLVDPADVVVTAPDVEPAVLAWPRRPPRVALRQYLPLPAPGAVRLCDLPAPDGFAACVAVIGS